VADQSVSVSMTLSDLERPGEWSNFQADLLNNARTVRPTTTKFGRITRMGRSVFLGISHAATARGRCPSARSPILGAHFYLCVHPFSQSCQI